MDNPTSQRAALWVATAASFIIPFMTSAVTVALPSIGAQLHLDPAAMGWIATSYLLAAAVVLLPVGRWADITGRRRVFLIGLGVFGAGSLLSGVAHSLAALLSFRVAQGLGAGMIFGTSIAILTSVFPPGERGRVLGIAVASVYLGLALGPFLGGVLTEHLGWHSVFLAGVPVVVLTMALALRGLKGEWAEARGEPFDAIGAVLYSLALAALMLGMSRLPAPVGGGIAAGGLLGLVVFALWELRTPAPLLDVGLLLRNRVFACSNLAALINYSATTAVAFLLSLYLQSVQGLSPREAGTVLLIQPLMQAVFSPLAGRLSDRREPRLIASAGMILTAAGLAALVLLTAQTSLAFVGACLAVLGFGFALFSSPNTNAVMGAVERRLYGVASGTLGTMRLTGQMLSIGFATLMLAAAVGKAEITPAHFPQFLYAVKASFAVFAVLCVCGTFASLARGRVRTAPTAGA